MTPPDLQSLVSALDLVAVILGQELSILLRKEIDVTASLVGAVAYVTATAVGAERMPSAAIGSVTAFVIRGCAIKFGWMLPIYRSRPGRSQGL